MVTCGQYITFLIMIVVGKSGRSTSILNHVSPTGEAREANAGRTSKLNNEDLPQCRILRNKLLSNLYVDYFRSSGSCVANGGEVLNTFRGSRKMEDLTEEEEEKLVDEMCKKLPDSCHGNEGRRSSRLFFGVGKLLLYNFQKKIQRIGDFLSGKAPPPFSNLFNGPPLYGSYGPSPYQLFAPQADEQKSSDAPYWPPPSGVPQGTSSYPGYPISAPNYQRPVLPPAPPYPVGPQPPPGYGAPSPYPNYYGYPPPVQNPFSNIYNPPAFDDPCSGNPGCPSSKPETANKPATRRTITKRSICEVESDVIFPMVGKAAMDDTTVNILQDFPNLLQPVFFRRCRNQYLESAGRKCVQEFLPMNFFISSQNESSTGSLLPQEFVLVESGCRPLDETEGS